MPIISDVLKAAVERLKRDEALLAATQAQVFKLREELATTKADLAKTKQRLSEIELQGDFSPPMTKKEMAAIVKLRPRAFNTFAKSHGLRTSGRQQFQIRLNAMDAKTRKLFE